ncbi:unnamed protein product [Paramecium primaurelia]|uniref:Uncharacterized protein n=1 Tax=Paramecium primaurelia TaxID=5886 RepID=A0A8S1M9M1_PARPR|nr:unnamed protein product [Paramecium primaurelia]
MNHESENTPFIQQEFPSKEQQDSQQEQPKIVSINTLFLQNTTQAFNPGKMISKQFYVFSRSLKKSIEQYRNNENIQFTKNLTTSLEEFDGVSYNNQSLNEDKSITAQGVKLFGKTISKIKDNITRTQQPQEPQEPQENQQQNKNETQIQQNQKQDEENI